MKDWIKGWVWGVLLGSLLLSGGWWAWGAISQEVGINIKGSTTWKPWKDYTEITDALTTQQGVPGVVVYANAGNTAGENIYPIAPVPVGNNLSASTYSLQTASLGYAATSTTAWAPLSTFTTMADNNAPFSTGGSMLAVRNFGILLDAGAACTGGCAERIRATTSNTLAQTAAIGIQAVAPYSAWSVTSTPAANTQATATKALIASTQHVATSI